MVSSTASESIYVLAFDYRGFGLSTGSPTEDGLIEDAIAVITWAIKTATVASHRIVLQGQSLGTGLVAAAASHFSSQTPKVDFAGIILCAGFTDAAAVLTTYSIHGIPLLAPLRLASGFENWFFQHL